MKLNFNKVHCNEVKRLIKGTRSDVKTLLLREEQNEHEKTRQYPSLVIRLYEKIPDKLKDLYFWAHAYGKCRICPKRKKCWKEKGFKSVEEAQLMWREAGRPMIWQGMAGYSSMQNKISK